MSTAPASSNISPAPASNKEPVPLEILRAQLEQRAAEFRMVLPSHITPEKLQRTILTAVQSTPALIRCERRSFLTAAMKAAQDGLLPDGREAAIVPFNHKFKDEDGWHSVKIAQYMPMVWGLVKKMLQSGEIKTIRAKVVYRQEVDAGRFVYEEGAEPVLRHKPIIDPDFSPSDEDVALAYSVATFADGSWSAEVLKRWEIDQIREASQTGAQFDAKGNPREAKGPWVEWFTQMAIKSVIRRHAKSLPMSGDVLPDGTPRPDVEGEDIDYAAKSAVALLDSQLPDEPEPEAIAGPEPEPEPEPEPVSMRVREEIAPEPVDSKVNSEPEPEAAPEPEPLRDEGDIGPDPTAPQAPDEAYAPEPETDEYGITKDPNETLAEDFIRRAEGCELLMDLRNLEKEADLALAAMPAEMAGPVDEAFARARQRLTPAPKRKAPQ